jgi:hypothetical protein
MKESVKKNRSSRTLPSHQTYTHNPKPNKPVVSQLATSQNYNCTQLTPKTGSSAF